MPVVAEEEDDEDALLRRPPPARTSLRSFDSELDESTEALMARGPHDGLSPHGDSPMNAVKKRKQVRGGLQRHYFPGLAALGLAACLMLLATAMTTPRTSSSVEVPKELRDFSAQEVANAFAALAQSSLAPSSAQLSELAQRAEAVVGDMRARDVSTTLDAYAKLGKHPPERLLDVLGRQARVVVQDMDAKDVTDTMNAFAKLEEFLEPGAGRAETELLREELAEEAVAEGVVGDRFMSRLGSAPQEVK